MPRMRTIAGAVQHLKTADPDCAITEHFLRSCVKSGRIKSRMAGRKYLIDLDSLEKWLSSPLVEDETGQYGTLRKIT